MTNSKVHIIPLGREEESLLAARLREGRPEAFEMLYRRFAPRVMGLAVQLLGEPQAAEDATQEAFVRVFRGVHRFRGDSGLGTWIHRIGVNVCLTEIERRNRRPSEPGEPPPEMTDPADPEKAAIARSSASALIGLLRELEPVKQVTFYLHHVEGMDAAEVAEILDDSRDAVLKRLQRTRREVLDLWRRKNREAGIADSGTGAQ